MGVDLLSRWVSSPDLLGRDGHCLSWSNPAHPGYAYPELSGLLLSFLCHCADQPARARQLHDALSTGAADNGVSRRGITYTFDTAMALRGLIDYRADADLLDPPVPQWTRALVRAVSSATATSPAQGLTAATAWSMAFGPHQAKIAAALVAAQRRGVLGGAGMPGGEGVLGAIGEPRGAGQPGEPGQAGGTEIGAALDVLRDRTVSLQDDRGRFRIHAASTMTYVHAQCYALEGLMMSAEQRPGAGDEIALGVEWLASVQGAGGGWRAWHDGVRASGPERSDATAQAVRLMRLVDADRYGTRIADAVTFLSRCQGGHPGLPYEPGAADITSWSTLFAAQALAPAGHRLRPMRATDIV